MKKKRKPPPSQTGRGLRTERDRAKDHSAINTSATVREQSKHREVSRVSFWPGREPFTVAKLQKILEDKVLLKGQRLPGIANLNAMAWALNDIHGAFWFRKTTAPQSRFKQERAARVHDAIQTLICFFDQRMQAWDGESAAIVDRERRLYGLFCDFLRAMMDHNFELDIDTDDAALMPHLENWHQIAEVVAGSFRIAMLPQKFGISNKGPVVRFVVAVMPLMANESPTVSSVAQHLKRRARAKSFQQGQSET